MRRAHQDLKFLSRMNFKCRFAGEVEQSAICWGASPCREREGGAWRDEARAGAGEASVSGETKQSFSVNSYQCQRWNCWRRGAPAGSGIAVMAAAIGREAGENEKNIFEETVSQKLKTGGNWLSWLWPWWWWPFRGSERPGPGTGDQDRCHHRYSSL